MSKICFCLNSGAIQYKIVYLHLVFTKVNAFATSRPGNILPNSLDNHNKDCIFHEPEPCVDTTIFQHLRNFLFE